MHTIDDLITLFNTCFLDTYNTQLVKGGDEPLYLPSGGDLKHNTLYFAHGFFASALHETAHWLIAGEERRKLVDFGYWYEPDGRTKATQELFEKMEAKPQALEWILSKACGFSFRLSLDNLNGSESDSTSFKMAVFNQVKTYCEKGLPLRADLFRTSLCSFYHTKKELVPEDFLLQEL